jgi:tail assembly chaperone E/41/14-like protein
MSEVGQPAPAVAPVVVKLTTPIRGATGDMVDSVTLRPLKVSDLRTAGYPVKGSGDGSMEPIPERIAILIGRLGGLPDSSVNMLSIPDFTELMGVVIGGFTAPASDSPATQT